MNGSVVHDVSVGCMADTIPRNTLRAGGEVVCAVTPTDSGGPGPTTTIHLLRRLRVGSARFMSDEMRNTTEPQRRAAAQ